MAEPPYSKAQLEAAVERLSEPERFREAEQIVASVAPELQAVLVGSPSAGR